MSESLVPMHWTVSRLAVEFKCDRRQLVPALRNVTPVEERGRSKRYHLEPVARAYFGNKKGAPASGSRLADAREREAIARADVAELEAKRRREELAPVADMLTVMSHEYGIVRQRLLMLPARLGPLVEGLKDREARKVIQREIDKALNELSNPKGKWGGRAPMPAGARSKAN